MGDSYSRGNDVGANDDAFVGGRQDPQSIIAVDAVRGLTRVVTDATMIGIYVRVDTFVMAPQFPVTTGVGIEGFGVVEFPADIVIYENAYAVDTVDAGHIAILCHVTGDPLARAIV